MQHALVCVRHNLQYVCMLKLTMYLADIHMVVRMVYDIGMYIDHVAYWANFDTAQYTLVMCGCDV